MSQLRKGFSMLNILFLIISLEIFRSVIYPPLSSSSGCILKLCSVISISACIKEELLCLLDIFEQTG